MNQKEKVAIGIAVTGAALTVIDSAVGTQPIYGPNGVLSPINTWLTTNLKVGLSAILIIVGVGMFVYYKVA